MKHLKYFEKDSDYKEFIKTDELVKPNVSHCVDTKKVYYKPTEKLTNNISVFVRNVYAPQGSPAIIFESEYPVTTELTVSCRCFVMNNSGDIQRNKVITTAIPYNETVAIYELEKDEITDDLPYLGYSVTNITECKCNPEKDSVYKYEMILNI